MHFLRFFFWFTDTGFVAYWLITLSGVIPDAYLFKDYRNEILNAWNWSFFPLDIFISVFRLSQSLFPSQRSCCLEASRAHFSGPDILFRITGSLLLDSSPGF